MSYLKDIALFASLDDELLEHLEDICKMKKYNRGSTLFYQGDVVENLVILTAGKMRLYKTASNDKEVTLHLFEPVSLVAEAAMLMGMNYPATAEFLEDSEVILIDAKSFESRFLNDNRVARVLINSLSRKVKMLESIIEQSIVMNAHERVLMLVKKSPNLLNSMKHYEIAQMLHLTPETLSRVLKQLLKDGIIFKEENLWSSSLSL